MGNIVKGIGDAVTKTVSAPLDSLGNITGLHISPSGVNWSAPNPNIGDIWNVGSMFAPGGNLMKLGGLSHLGTANFAGNLLGPMANIGKSNLGQWMSFAGRGQGQGQGGNMAGGQGYTMPGGNLSNADMIGSMLGQAWGPAMMEGQYNQGATMRRLQSLDKAYSALDPPNFMASIDQYGRTATAGAQQNAKRFANSSPNLASGAAEGASLDALNQGNIATNQYAQNLLNPFAMSNAYQAQASLMSPQNTMQNYGQLMSLLGLGNQQRMSDLYYQANRPPSTLENFAQYLGGPLDQWFQRQVMGIDPSTGTAIPGFGQRGGGYGPMGFELDPEYEDMTRQPLDWKSIGNAFLGLG